jgi:paraquat-inducible protein A
MNPPALKPEPGAMVCHGCDAVHQLVNLQRQQVARCSRCRAVLGRGQMLSIRGQLAFTLAAGILLVVGNLMPLVTLELRGIRAAITLPQAIALTWSVGQPLVAVLAGAIALLFPIALVLLRLYLLWPLTRGHIPLGFRTAMKMLHFSIEWSMVEVFLLSTFVAMVRCASLATVKPGVGLWAYALVTLLLTALTAAGLRTLWQLSLRAGQKL